MDLSISQMMDMQKALFALPLFYAAKKEVPFPRNARTETDGALTKRGGCGVI